MPGTHHSENDHRSAIDWDTRGLGIAGLKGGAGPLGWPAVLFLFFTFVLVGVHIDSLNLTEMVKTAIAPLTVLLAVGGAPLLLLIADRADQNPNRQATTLEKCSMLISLVTTLAIVSILVHILLPAGQARDMAGVTSVCLIILLPIALLRTRAILSFIDGIGRSSDPSTPLPAKARRWAWVVDLLSSGLIVLAIVWLLAPRIERLATTAWPAPVTLWTSIIAVYYVYQVIAIRTWGCTLGQQLVRVRIVSSRSGERPRLVTIMIRTFIPTLAGFFYLLLPILGSSTSSLMDSRTMPYVISIGFALSMIVLIVGVASLVWLREIHPRGQGLLDLITKTVSIPYPKGQSRSQTEQPDGSQAQRADSARLE